MPNHNRSYSGCSAQRAVAQERIIAQSKAIHNAAARISTHALNSVNDHALSMSNHALSTARIIIGAEELLRQRVRSGLRVAVAAIFFAISGLISLGANVTIAFAKKVSHERESHGHTSRIKRSATHRSSGVRYLHHVKQRKSHVRSYSHRSDAARNSMRGVASWYGNEFHNRQTASGVRFDTHAMMAAHRTLPFGTKVRVTNMDNAKSCIVEITDRGPFSKGRIIDLSYAAAEEIGMTETGVANVEIEILGNRFSQPKIFEDLAFQNKGPVLDRIPRPSSRQLASLLNAPVAASDDAGR